MMTLSPQARDHQRQVYIEATIALTNGTAGANSRLRATQRDNARQALTERGGYDNRLMQILYREALRQAAAAR